MVLIKSKINLKGELALIPILISFDSSIFCQPDTNYLTRILTN